MPAVYEKIRWYYLRRIDVLHQYEIREEFSHLKDYIRKKLYETTATIHEIQCLSIRVDTREKTGKKLVLIR